MPNISFCFPAIFSSIFKKISHMWPYGSASSVWTCPLNSGQIWKYPEVLGIEKSVHLLLRIQFSIPKVEPIRSKNNIFIQKNTGKQISETYQNATWCLFPIGIFSHQSLWNFLWMEHVCSVIILTKWDYLPFGFWCFYRSIGHFRKVGIPRLDPVVRGSPKGTMNQSCWWDISSRKNIACFDPSWWSFNLFHVFFIDVHVTFTTWTTIRSGTRPGHPGPKVGHRPSVNNDGVAWHRGEVVKIPFQSRKGCALVGRTVYQGRPHPDDVSVQVTNGNVQWSTDGDDMTDVCSYLFDSLFESQIFKIIQNTKKLIQ